MNDCKTAHPLSRGHLCSGFPLHFLTACPFGDTNLMTVLTSSRASACIYPSPSPAVSSPRTFHHPRRRTAKPDCLGRVNSSATRSHLSSEGRACLSQNRPTTPWLWDGWVTFCRSMGGERLPHDPRMFSVRISFVEG